MITFFVNGDVVDFRAPDTPLLWALRDHLGLTGFDAVRESWMQIFASNVKLNVRVSEASRFDGPSVAVRSVVEAITAPGTESSPQFVNATNVYVLTDAGWRIAVHHASPPEEAVPAEEDEAAQPHTLH